jgi:hypothetical protein
MVLDNLVSNKAEKRHFYWTLIVEPSNVQAGVWDIQDEEAKVHAISPPVVWETDEELVGAADTALSSIVQTLDVDISEPSETVFGVTNRWVAKGEIKQEYLDKLKKICSELSLEPKGFVVLAESVAHFYKSEEGSPLSAVVIGVTKESIEITVFKLGNIVGTTMISRSVSVAGDVMEGLLKFNVDNHLPSRFLLFSSKEVELEEVRQSLLEADWKSGKLKLLHTPKVELIDSKKKVLAVSLAGASEISKVLRASLVEGETSLGSEVKADKDLPVDSIDRDDLKEDVIASKKKEVKEEVGGEVVEPKESLDPRTFGFAIGKDVSLEKNIGSGIDSAPKAEELKLKKKKIPVSGILGKIKSMLPIFRRKDSGFRKYGVSQRRIYVIGAVLLTFLIAMFIAWWYLPKARVTIYVAPKRFEEKIPIYVDPDTSESELEKGIIKGDRIETEVSSDKTKSTTGVKTVGERAKGEVVIFRVGEGVTLSAGSSLVGPSELKFTLDDDVTLASGSAGSPSSSKSLVTAVAIGAEYNLAKDSGFVVGNYPASEIEARSETDFSGGSSKEVSVVSKEDVEDLEEELTEELIIRRGKAGVIERHFSREFLY